MFLCADGGRGGSPFARECLQAYEVSVDSRHPAITWCSITTVSRSLVGGTRWGDSCNERILQAVAGFLSRVSHSHRGLPCRLAHELVLILRQQESPAARTRPSTGTLRDLGSAADTDRAAPRGRSALVAGKAGELAERSRGPSAACSRLPPCPHIRSTGRRSRCDPPGCPRWPRMIR